MIRVDRDPMPLPASLVGVRVERAWRDADEFFRSRTRAARQRQHHFDDTLLAEDDVMAALRSLFHGNCAFCGDDADRLVPHRLRPPQDAVDSDGLTSRRHYFWLAYEWENLYLACVDCVNAQGAKFPVDMQRARVGTQGGALDKERPWLLDPCRDDPERLLVYLRSGEVVSRYPRGAATIETFALNREDLVWRRAEAYADVAARLAVAKQALAAGRSTVFYGDIGALFAPGHPFAGLRRQFANQWVQVRPRMVDRALQSASDGRISLTGLVGDLDRVSNSVMQKSAEAFFAMERLEAVSVTEVSVPEVRFVEAERPLPRYEPDDEPWRALASAEIRSVEIENFRGIRRLRLQLAERPGEGSWSMLLGENGVGKSSILQAIALALCDGATLDELPVDPAAVLRQGAQQGMVRVHLVGVRGARTLRFEHRSPRFEVDGPAEGMLVAGYGSTRLLPSRRGESATSRVASLFDASVSLTAPAEWLPDLDDEHFDAVARALKRLLHLGERDELRRTRDGLIQIVREKAGIPLEHESDGYKAMAAFALDMMQLFLRRWGSLEAAEGVVLVDELGTHLHPRWQMRVTGSLREAFPRVQFIATTHDPLCLRGLRDGEVIVLRKPARGRRVYALQDDLPPVDGLAVDQILTSEHFGLNSTVDPRTEHLFESYYALLSRPRGPLAEETLERLRSELAGLRLLGTTRRERLALEAADQFLAEQSTFADEHEYLRLKQSTRDRIGRIWRESLA